MVAWSDPEIVDPDRRACRQPSRGCCRRGGRVPTSYRCSIEPAWVSLQNARPQPTGLLEISPVLSNPDLAARSSAVHTAASANARDRSRRPARTPRAAGARCDRVEPGLRREANPKPGKRRALLFPSVFCRARRGSRSADALPYPSFFSFTKRKSLISLTASGSGVAATGYRRWGIPGGRRPFAGSESGG